MAQMTVAMLLWSSVMTWIYSCCWSTGHGAVIYRVISPSRWRCGTVLSSMPHAQNVGAPCSQLLLSPRIQPTHCDTVSYTVGKDNTSTLKTLKDWAFRGYSKKILVCCLPHKYLKLNTLQVERDNQVCWR